jgi:hypothetical protein
LTGAWLPLRMMVMGIAFAVRQVSAPRADWLRELGALSR